MEKKSGSKMEGKNGSKESEIKTGKLSFYPDVFSDSGANTVCWLVLYCH